MQVTTREKILKILGEAEKPLTPLEICLQVGFRPSEEQRVLTHIHHIAKTIRRSHPGLRVLMQPPACRACGYLFSKMEKPRRPRKCPRCREQRIDQPRFIIE